MNILSDPETYVTGHVGSIINYRGSTIGKADFDGWDGRHRATVDTSPDDSEAADALVATRRALDAEGQDFGDERNVRTRSRHLRTLGHPSISPGSVNTPRFETVSSAV